MNYRTMHRALGVLPMLVLAAPAIAAENGCYWSADGNYQLGQTAQITVWNDMPPGQQVRDEKAHGDGNILATCMRGQATFEGDYTVARDDGMVTLTVDGQPSGFGIEVYIEERDGSDRRYFPHRYQRTFRLGEPVRSNDADIGYRVVRTTGPVRFGRVDSRTIAQQWTYQPDGARTRAFRHLKIYELYFVRPTCSISGDTLNQTVDVGRYHVGNFATPERATPWVPFYFRVESCAEPVGMIASFTFGKATDADPVLDELFSLTGPKNVGLEIASDDTKTTLRPGVPFLVNAVGTGRSYQFNARLRETQPTVRGGEFRRPLLVQVEFF
ncbi:type 1 fimbria pilin [Luteibacter sp. 1214]|uniref:fimbrial protein n=1 Tax=Luteibacter sp. 1214 TaxID=2817735 RepID=UPI00285AB457|nr:fimbrial protein [Luteibacter sp. 1214]MDR6642298.1 type 1 fimbria pilin [Luteibacter sp. 1214]